MKPVAVPQSTTIAGRAGSLTSGAAGGGQGRCRSRPGAAEAPASLPRRVRPESQAQVRRQSIAIGNIGSRGDAATAGQAAGGHAAAGCCDSHPKPRSHDTSRRAWAKLMARAAEELPLVCPACGGNIRLIAFITEPGPIRKTLTHLGEPRSGPRQCRPPGGRPMTGPNSCTSTTTETSCRPHPTSCPRSTSTASDRCQTPGHDKAARPPESERLRADGKKNATPGGKKRALETTF
jgi:hypothetical protein